MTSPFKVLAVSKTATKPQIMAAVAGAMRERSHETRQIAEAQKELFDPVTRAAAEFRHFIDIDGCVGSWQYEIADSAAVPTLELLDYPDEKGTAAG